MSKLVKYRRVIDSEYIVTVELPDDESPENEAIEAALEAIEGQLVDGNDLEGDWLDVAGTETKAQIVKVKVEHYEFPGWEIYEMQQLNQDPAIK